MLKLRNSTYEPGRPKAHGLNLKETHIALTWFFYTPKEAMAKDLLFTQITLWSLEWLFKNRELVTVGKAYSGFTDQELLKLDKFIRANTTNRFGPVER